MKSFPQNNSEKRLALVGTGPVGFGFITQFADSLRKNSISNDIASIDIFDIYAKNTFGAGLPYNSETTDLEHLINVSSEYVFDVTTKKSSDNSADSSLESKDSTTSENYKNWSNSKVSGNLREWFEANEEDVKIKFKQILQERFEEKFKKRFDVEFDENLELTAKQQELKEHYDKIWQGIEKRYLNLEVGNTYHPRILVGMRNIIIFEEAIEEIRKNGVEVNFHEKTEITDLKKLQPEEKSGARIEIDYVTSGDNWSEEKRTEFTDLILATGRWRVQENLKKRYIPEVWPISKFKESLYRNIEEEIEKRKENGDENKEIKIAIQGQSLTAIDAVKTIFNEGLFEEKDGKLIFTPKFFDGYSVKVDMTSRSGVMQQIKGGIGWNKQFENGLPEGIEINQNIIQELASEQNGKIYLWQVMLMTARGIENGYRAEGNVQENEANKIICFDKADQLRDFVKLIISNVKGCVAEIKNEDLDAIKGSTIEQIREFRNKFGLELESANYQPIAAAFEEMFLNKDPIDQLRDNLALAKSGDIPKRSEEQTKTYSLWKAVYGALDSLSLAPYLNSDESAYRFQVLDRVMSAFNNGMPIQSAEELNAMYEAGVIDFKKLSKGRESTVDGLLENYDIVASAMGYNLDITKNISPLAKKMYDRGYFNIDKELWANNDEEFLAKKEDLETRFGKESAEKMLSRMKLQEDGKYYYSNGDYKRIAFDDKGSIVASPAREMVDENNQPTFPGLIIHSGSGLNGAIENGKKIFLQKFAMKERELGDSKNNELNSPNPATKATGALEVKEYTGAKDNSMQL